MKSAVIKEIIKLGQLFLTVLAIAFIIGNAYAQNPSNKVEINGQVLVISLGCGDPSPLSNQGLFLKYNTNSGLTTAEGK